MGLGNPPLQLKVMLESNPLKSRTVVGRLGVATDSSTSDTQAEQVYERE